MKKKVQEGPVQSLNTKVDLVCNGTSYQGLNEYGKIMIGDRGFEFYNDRDVKKYIQIPWDEIDYVIASVVLKGKWIPRFVLRTKQNGDFRFAAKNPKKLLRAVRNYVPADHMVQSLSFFQVLKRGIKGLFHKKKA